MSRNTNVPKNVRQDNFKSKKRGPKGRSSKMRRSSITYSQIGAKVLSDVRALKRLLNVEDKYSDVIANAQNVPNTPTYVLLNGLSLGTSAITRNGQSIRCADLQFNCTITISSAASASFVRLVLLQDTQPNASVPGADDVYVDTTNVRSMRTVGYNTRFRIILDELVSLTAVNLTSYAMTRLFPLSFHVEFNTGNAGTIADITKGSLYLLYFSNEGTNYPLIGYYSRFSFVDN